MLQPVIPLGASHFRCICAIVAVAICGCVVNRALAHSTSSEDHCTQSNELAKTFCEMQDHRESALVAYEGARATCQWNHIVIQYSGRHKKEFGTFISFADPDVHTDNLTLSSCFVGSSESWSIIRIGPKWLAGNLDGLNLLAYDVMSTTGAFDAHTPRYTSGFFASVVHASGSQPSMFTMHLHHMHISEGAYGVFHATTNQQQSCLLSQGGNACFLNEYPPYVGVTIGSDRFEVAAAFNDVRPQGSAPREFWFEAASKIVANKPKMHLSFVTTAANFLWSTDLDYDKHVLFPNYHSIPINSLQALWAAFPAPFDADIMGVRVHTHWFGEREVSLWQAEPEALGLNVNGINMPRNGTKFKPLPILSAEHFLAKLNLDGFASCKKSRDGVEKVGNRLFSHRLAMICDDDFKLMKGRGITTICIMSVPSFTQPLYWKAHIINNMCQPIIYAMTGNEDKRSHRIHMTPTINALPSQESFWVDSDDSLTWNQ